MAESDPGVPTRERVLATLAYLGPFLIVPLLVRKKPRFLRYHVRQGMYLFVLFVILFLITIGLLYLTSDRALDAQIVYRVLAVFFLLEVVVYVAGSFWLAVQASRARMPMVPVLGEFAGEV